MTQQFVLTLIAAGIGFASAIFLFIGSISQSPREMILDTKPFWEFNPQALRSIAFKKAHSLIGGFLLAVSFFLQIVAAAASPTELASLPRAIDSWLSLLSAVLVVTGLLGAILARLQQAAIMREVMRLHREGINSMRSAEGRGAT
jgi:hypothetical protein